MHKILNVLFSYPMAAAVAFMVTGDYLCDAIHGRAVALNIAFTFTFALFGYIMLGHARDESYREGKIDGTIDTWALAHKTRRYGVASVDRR